MIKIEQIISKPLVECVLNVSIAEDIRVIEKIKRLFTEKGKVYVLHTDIGLHANRTVFTIVGVLENVLYRIDKLFNYAIANFDINNHHGIHPRIGIIDVIPFIPLKNIDSEELIPIIKRWSQKLSMAISLPVFFYSKMAVSPQRRGLHYFRKNGIEGLAIRMSESLVPDYGPRNPHPLLGASCVTVRGFMGAFNINLNTKDLTLAKELQKRLLKIRNLGRRGKAPDLSEVKFLAWYMPEYHLCQMSTNIYNLQKVKLLELYKFIEEVAKGMGIQLKGAELIGMIPLAGICEGINNYKNALDYINLNSVRPFQEENQVLDFKLDDILWEV